MLDPIGGFARTDVQFIECHLWVSQVRG